MKLIAYTVSTLVIVCSLGLTFYLPYPHNLVGPLMFISGGGFYHAAIKLTIAPLD